MEKKIVKEKLTLVLPWRIWLWRLTVFNPGSGAKQAQGLL